MLALRVAGGPSQQGLSAHPSPLPASRYAPFGAASERPTSARTHDAPPPPQAQARHRDPRGLRYDGVDDAELNWRLDSRASLSDYAIVVLRARPGPHAPDFDSSDVRTLDLVAKAGGGAPRQDAYYVHKAMIAVGSRRSELLGRRMREAEAAAPDGRSSEANVHETVMLEGAADAMGTVLDFCYYPDRALDIAVQLMLLNFYCNLTLEDGEEIPDPAPVPPSPSVPSLPSPPSSFLPSYHVSDFWTS